MRAILIDPAKREITEVQGDFTDNEEIRRVTGLGTLGTIPFAQKGIIAVIDDNGHVESGNPCFSLATYDPNYPLAGPMLVCGLKGPATAELPSAITVERVTQLVTWLDVESTGEFSGAGPTENGYTMGSPIVRPRAAI